LNAPDAAQASFTKTLVTPFQVVSKDSLIAGKYKIIDEVGAGGMGIVYKAEDLKLKRCVALKFLPSHFMDSPELKERFLIEAQAAAALSHPNICVIHEVGESEERPYIAMEYVEGETLRDRIKKGPLKPEEALDIAAQIASGLGEAHHKGIIHRDIKSANIMVTHTGQAKVMDFGLAKLRGGSSLTKSQTTLGTIAYMSPEQARGDELDQRTDIWSLGVVLYEMLAGRLPFRGDHDQTVIFSILHQEPESLIKVRPGTAPELEHVVGQALAKKPADRYQTMEEFREDLGAVAEGLKPLKAKAKPAAVKLAVLPFANLTGDPEQEYLSDGLTQEMIAQLGRLHPQSLSVIARTSVMRYKKTETPIDQIGRELGVDYVLEGSAQREGSRVRIIAELIQVRDQTQLWADIVEREMSGILALQNDVAEKVAKALAIKLLPSEQARLADVRPVNPEAYEAYLKGLQHSYKLLPADLDTALQYFELALKKDPGYALAYTGISFVWTCRQQMGLTPPKEATPKAKAAAQKSLALDDTVAEAHYALANIMAWGDWDWTGAEMEFKRAIELNPNFPDARIYYSHLLSITGRPDDAMAEVKRVLELDPYNSLFQSLAAADFLLARRYDEAIAQARSAQRTNADDPVAHNLLQVCFFMKGMYEEAFAEWKAMWNIPLYGNRDIAEALERGYAEAGFTGAMRHATEAWTKVVYERGEPWYLALAYVMAGDKERALGWLEKGFELHDANMAYLGFPGFDGLRSDPRFQDLVRRMKLPELK
jgi:serine/threonine protein kinase/tetratricopeptide (TPR) repeat protein